MRKTISSPFTFFFKFVFPSLWIATGLYVILRALLEPNAKNVFATVLLFAIWAGVSILIDYRNNFPLKRACLRDGFLFVSNYVREVKISLMNIDDVRASAHPWMGWWRWPPYRVIITLKQSTEFGTRIMIIPGFYYKDVVDEIRDAIKTQRSVSQANAPADTRP
jgi:hypothetical protein